MITLHKFVALVLLVLPLSLAGCEEGSSYVEEPHVARNSGQALGAKSSLCPTASKTRSSQSYSHKDPNAVSNHASGEVDPSTAQPPDENPTPANNSVAALEDLKQGTLS